MTISRDVNATKPGYHVPILVLSVKIDPEYFAIEDYLPRCGAELIRNSWMDEQLHIDRWNLPREGLPNLEIATGFVNRMGNASSALETYIFLERLSPRFVFLCGIAGSLRPKKAKLGDVVVGKSVDWWILNKITDQKFDDCIRIGNKYFRLVKKQGTMYRNYWDKKLTKFQKNNSELLPSNNNAELLKLKSNISAKGAKAHRNKIHYAGIMSWEFHV